MSKYIEINVKKKKKIIDLFWAKWIIHSNGNCQTRTQWS